MKLKFTFKYQAHSLILRHKNTGRRLVCACWMNHDSHHFHILEMPLQQQNAQT